MHSPTKPTLNSFKSSQIRSPSPLSNKNNAEAETKQQIANFQALFCPKAGTSTKPCQKFGLDPKNLENEALLKMRSYRRLYNIVANDQTEANQIFRPNLIKQLYFLLQITPFIENSLQENFLNKVEEWYNSNDHKKIKLSKNLDKMMKNMLESKSRQEKQMKKSTVRPKTGVQWDTSLNPFLRPYTAKLRSSKTSQHRSRPESSKYGASTNAYTNFIEDSSDKFEQMNKQIDQWRNTNNELEQICDIEEEWQRSLDFKKKHRTLHPEEEPTYEKLMNLISGVKEKMSEEQNKEQDKNMGYKSKQYWQKKRKIQSAVQAKQIENAKALAEEQIEIQNRINLALDPEDNEVMNDDGERQDQEQPIYESEEQEGSINFNLRTGKFTSDARSSEGRIIRESSKGKGKMYKMLNGVKILRPFTAKQANIIVKLDQYSNLQQNKQVVLGTLDNQCVEKYKQYMKNKNLIRRQIFRKSQSKRYMENLKKTTKVMPYKQEQLKSRSPIEREENFHSKFSLGSQQVNKIEMQENKQTPIIFDFAAHSQCQNSGLAQPKYNTKTFFQSSNANKIPLSFQGINSLDESNIQNSNYPKMTYQKRLISQQKFDPLHKTNVEKYNQEILQEIGKIKQKFGGKITASTDSLMKALYVDAPLPFLTSKQTSEKQNNALLVPDRRYLMVSNGEKKKRKTKLKKVGSKKSYSQSKR